jgi:glycosyltransferase involved in cell wall biosynthesis
MSKVYIDSSWFNPNTGIGRFAIEVSTRFTLFESELIGSSVKSGVFSVALHPLRLRYLLGKSISNRDSCVFWSPTYLPVWRSPLRQCITIHDLNHLYCYSAAHANYVRRFLFPLWRKASKLIVVSNYTKNCLIKELGEGVTGKIVVAYNGISDSFKVPESGFSVQGYLLYVGNRRSYKNVIRMLTAFSKVVKTLDINFYMTGELDDSVSRLIEYLNIQNRVFFIGFPCEVELANLYRGALACVFISLHEGFGLPPLEALACGTPVLASNCSSIPEVCGQFACYVDPLDVDEICDGMREIVLNNSSWRVLVSCSSGWLKRYSWDKSSSVIEDAILSVF